MIAQVSTKEAKMETRKRRRTKKAKLIKQLPLIKPIITNKSQPQRRRRRPSQQILQPNNLMTMRTTMIRFVGSVGTART